MSTIYLISGEYETESDGDPEFSGLDDRCYLEAFVFTYRDFIQEQSIFDYAD